MNSNSGNKTTITLVIVGIIVTLVLWIFIYMISIGVSRGNQLPVELRSNNENSASVFDMRESVKIAVHYPEFENEEVEVNFKKQAQQILDDFAYLIKESDDIIYINVDYVEHIYNSKYVSIEYTGEIDNQKYNYDFFSAHDGSEINNQVLDDYIVKQIMYETRAKAKQNPATAEYAHSIEFALASADNNLPPYQFTIVGDKLIVEYLDFYDGNPLEISMPLNHYSSHINLDLGIEQIIDDSIVRVPSRYVDPNRPMVALTFDDGPHTPTTSRIIEQLYKYDGAATFYMLGERVANPKEEGMILEIINQGHEIGTHSVTHPYLIQLEMDELEYELNGVQKYINEDITKGAYVIKTMRAPYGQVNEIVLEKSTLPFVDWTLDTADWANRERDIVYNGVMDNIEDGDIVLMHDLYESTVEAAIDMIVSLKEQGYQLVTVSELMQAKGVEMTRGQVYYGATKVVLAE